MEGEVPPSLGSISTENVHITLAFSDEETHKLAAHPRLALIGKFSHGAPPFRFLHRLVANTGVKGAFTVGIINPKHVLINFTREEDFTRIWLRRICFL